jgi:opacity protein-like surface antigen
MKPQTHILTRALVFAAAIFLSASGAFATELGDFLQKFTVQPEGECNWSGFYMGVNNGASFNHFDLSKQRTDVDLVTQFYDLINGDLEGGPGEIGEGQINSISFEIPAHHQTDTETIGGGQMGYNWMFGHFLVGFEGGFSGNGSEADQTTHQSQFNQLFLETEQQFFEAETRFQQQRMVETNWNAFIGGKLGFCWNRLLFYAGGGAAFTDVRFLSNERAQTSFFGFIGDGGDGENPTVNGVRRPNISAPSQDELPLIGTINSRHDRTQGDVMTGWYAGGGTDYMLTNLVSVGVEYRHVDWGDLTGGFMGGNSAIFATNSHLGLTADQVVFKVNFLIGKFH